MDMILFLSKQFLNLSELGEHLQYIFAIRWIVGEDGDQGKVIFPESFDGIITTEVNNFLNWCQ